MIKLTENIIIDKIQDEGIVFTTDAGGFPYGNSPYLIPNIDDLLEIPEEAIFDGSQYSIYEKNFYAKRFPDESNWMNFQVHAQDEELPIYDDYARVLGENTHREGVPF